MTSRIVHTIFMKIKIPLSALCSLILVSQTLAEDIPNPLIDYQKFNQIVTDSAEEREQHRLTEAQFLKAMTEKKVVLLDARSSARYIERHIKGAVNLPFTDFTAETLAAIIPAKDTKVLIYCNNNFLGDLIAFASKSPAASLNLSTYTSLKAYGYTNIFELGPLLDVTTTSIPFTGSRVK